MKTPAFMSQDKAGRALREARTKATMASANQLLTAFYVAVAISALVGQTWGAMNYLGWPVYAAGPVVALVEFGGIVLAAYSDARRRLGERALVTRLLSAFVAAFTVWLNWVGHLGSPVVAGLFCFFSALGYCLWLITSEARRRDALRAAGMLPPPPPAYELWMHWICHMRQTLLARSLAKADPELGLYGSLAAAKAQLSDQKRARDLETARQVRDKALAKQLRKRLAAGPGGDELAKLAVATYDLDRVARNLRDGADYDGLTALFAADLDPWALLAGSTSGTPTGTPANDAAGSPTGSPQEAAAVAPADAVPVHVRQHRSVRVIRCRHLPPSSTQIDLGEGAPDGEPQINFEQPTEKISSPAPDGTGSARSGHRAKGSPKKRTGKRVVRSTPLPDDVVTQRILGLPRDDNGTISVTSARKALGIGPDRARKHLLALGILAASDKAEARA